MRRIWGFVRIAFLVALAGAAVWVWSAKKDPATLSQDYLYGVATCSSCAKMGDLPKQRDVEIESLTGAQWPAVLISYLPPPIGSGGKAEQQGLYDAQKQRIKITGQLARLQASLPDARMQPIFRHTLRHEYGHALLEDWSDAHKLDDELYLAYGESADELAPGAYPKKLRPVVKEYREVGKNVYGYEYFTASFDEFFAESYARYMDGLEVPPHAKEFLTALAAE